MQFIVLINSYFCQYDENDKNKYVFVRGPTTMQLTIISFYVTLNQINFIETTMLMLPLGTFAIMIIIIGIIEIISDNAPLLCAESELNSA